MRYFRYYLLAAFAAFAVLSCQKEQYIAQDNPDNEPEVVDAPVVWTLDARFAPEEEEPSATPMSRTDLNDTKMVWTVGDVINVNGMNSQPLTSEDIDSEDASFAHFRFSDTPQGDDLVCVYPASAYSSINDEPYVTFPADQSYNPTTQSVSPSACILVGSGTGNTCAFQHAAVYLEISFNQAVKSVRVMANSYNYNNNKEMRAGMAVSGIRKINLGQTYLTEPALADIGTSVTVDLGEGVAADTPIILSVPPRNYSHGLNIMVVTTDNKYQIFKSGALQLSQKRGKLMGISFSLNSLKDYEGPGIYSADDYEAFVYSYERQDDDMMDRFRDANGVFHLRADISGVSFTRLGANAGSHAGTAGNNIHFAHEFDGHGHTIHQDSTSVALFSWLDSNGYIHDLELTGKFNRIANTGWGSANLVIRNHGEIRDCTNRMDIIINETEATAGSVFLTGLVLSNGGVMRDCKNYGHIEANLKYSGNRALVVGAIACVGNHEGDCGNFENCENYGNITITKTSAADPLTRSLQCGIGGICGKVEDGSIASRGSANAVDGKYYQKTPDFCFFENCKNEGSITYWEDENSSNSPIAVGGILGRCCKTSSDGASFSFSGYDGYYLITNYNCRNTGTLDVSSSAGQAAAVGVSGARELYVGGIAGVVHGICSKSGGYAVIRGNNNCTIKLGGTRGGEVAGGIIGGACICKVEMSTSTVNFQKSENPLITSTKKVGYCAASIGLAIKRVVIIGGTSASHSNAIYNMDASGLNGWSVAATGFGGVTNSSANATSDANFTGTYYSAWDSNGDGSTTSTIPYLILEVTSTNKYFTFTGKKPDGSSFASGADALYGGAAKNRVIRGTAVVTVNAAS